MSYEYQGVPINIINFYGGCDAKISGPPEDCYPAEDAEIEWKWDTGDDAINKLLNNLIADNGKYYAIIDQNLFDQVIENAQDEKDERAISEYEDRKYEQL